jgi:hypothetical protein
MHDGLHDEGLSFDTELLGKAALLNFRVQEVPIVSLWPQNESWRIWEALAMLAGLVRQRLRLVPLKYRSRGKDARVYAVPNCSAVWKVLRRDLAPKTKSDACSRPARFCVPQGTLANRLAKLILQVPMGLNVAKWCQRRPLLRRAVLSIFSLGSRRRFLDTDVLRECSTRLPAKLVAPFTIREHQWVVVRGIFGTRVHAGNVIEQELVMQLLEDRLKSLSPTRDREIGKRLIHDAIQTQLQLWQFGYFNSDVNLLTDTGFDRQGDLVFLDVGDLTSDFNVALKLLPYLRTSFGYEFTAKSLEMLSLEWADFFRTLFASNFTQENLIVHWNKENSRPQARQDLAPQSRSVCATEL